MKKLEGIRKIAETPEGKARDNTKLEAILQILNSDEKETGAIVKAFLDNLMYSTQDSIDEAR